MIKLVIPKNETFFLCWLYCFKGTVNWVRSYKCTLLCEMPNTSQPRVSAGRVVNVVVFPQPSRPRLAPGSYWVIHTGVYICTTLPRVFGFTPVYDINYIFLHHPMWGLFILTYYSIKKKKKGMPQLLVSGILVS